MKKLLLLLIIPLLSFGQNAVGWGFSKIYLPNIDGFNYCLPETDWAYPINQTKKFAPLCTELAQEIINRMYIYSNNCVLAFAKKGEINNNVWDEYILLYAWVGNKNIKANETNIEKTISTFAKSIDIGFTSKKELIVSVNKKMKSLGEIVALEKLGGYVDDDGFTFISYQVLENEAGELFPSVNINRLCIMQNRFITLSYDKNIYSPDDINIWDILDDFENIYTQFIDFN